jgi:hypothetical protein
VKAGVVEVKVRVVTKEPGAAKVLGTRDQGDCRARAGVEVGQDSRSKGLLRSRSRSRSRLEVKTAVEVSVLEVKAAVEASVLE